VKSLVLIALLVSGTASMSGLEIQGGSAPDSVVVRDAWIREAGASQKATGAFLVIENHSSQVVTLVSAKTSGAGIAELHKMELKDDKMSMKKVDEIQVPAGGTVELKPGGLHIMLFDLKQAFTPGTRTPLTLRFSNGVEKIVNAEVRPRMAMPPSSAGGAR